jgi:hypothetical protein
MLYSLVNDNAIPRPAKIQACRLTQFLTCSLRRSLIVGKNYDMSDRHSQYYFKQSHIDCTGMSEELISKESVK